MSHLASSDPLAKVLTRCFHVSRLGTFSLVELCLGARRRAHLRTSGCEILVCVIKKDTAGVGRLVVQEILVSPTCQSIKTRKNTIIVGHRDEGNVSVGM